MPSWYYEKKDLKRTPSIADGIDIDRENRYRREGARFIINVGTKMGLRYDTMATGVVYFHRFYMFHSFKTFPRYVTACCCLFLAGKVEETPKKCKDIIRTAKTFLADSQFAQFGDDPKEEVMTLERILLQTIKFDLQVDHPYGHLLKYAKSLRGDKAKLQNMVQMAWTFINDSLCTTLCLQWEPEVIAIALMYLAGKLSKFEVHDWNGRKASHKYWWDMFVEGMSLELLEDICHQVLDLYSLPVPSTPQDSPPATPPTKSTRKTSQPPSPVETVMSPTQMKPKEIPVGLPIPRLEPGEIKRKASVNETSKDSTEPLKIPRLMEGKAIPTITSSSPKKASGSQGSDTQPSSPSTPVQPEKSLKSDTSQHVNSEVPYNPNIVAVAEPPVVFPPASSFPTETAVSSVPPLLPDPVSSSYSTTVPRPTTTYTQAAPPFYPENQPFPNIQQPPPQIFPQRPPVPFQHPPPSGPPHAPPPGIHAPPPHQYPPNIPPFNSQFPPPRHQPPPNIPPPAPIPGITQHPPPPVPGMGREIPLPPPVRHIVPDTMYRPPNVDMFSSDQRPRPPRPSGGYSPNQNYGPRPRFDNSFRGRRDSDYKTMFPRENFDPGYHRPTPNKLHQEFERPPPPNRHYNIDHQMRKLERVPGPSANNPHIHKGGPTGIPPVRITGSN